MLIVYCESCGFRVSDDELKAGTAQKLDDNKYVCGKCVAAKKGAAPKPAASSSDGAPAIRTLPQKEEARTPARGTAHGHVLPPLASPKGAPAKPAKKDNSTLIMAGGGGGMLLLLVLVFAFSGKKEEPANPKIAADTHSPTAGDGGAKSVAGAKVTAEPAAKMVTAPSGTATPAAIPHTPAATTQALTASLQERERAMELENEERRNRFAAKALDEHKAWFQGHPEDPWAYRDRLTLLVGTYRSTPSAAEATKLLAELKMPEGDPPADSVVWHRAWDITRGAQQDMQQESYGQRNVLLTHPVEAGKPVYLTKKLKVPTDKPVLEFTIRSHDNGDFRLVIAIDNKTVLSEDIKPQWRIFALDLSSAKGREVDISLQHHNTDWNHEHAFWTVPRLVAAASPGARVVVPEGAPPSAPATVATTTPPQPAATPAMPSTPAVPGNSVANWRPLFDGKTLNCLLRQGFNGWRVEDGALVNSGENKTAAQTDMEFEDGTLRVKFELKEASYMQFSARQSEAGGYVFPFDRSILPSIFGKPQELIITCKGDEVSGTLNGKPMRIEANGKSKRGRLQFYARDGLMRISSLEFTDSVAPAPAAGAATPVTSAPASAEPARTGALSAEASVLYETALSDVYALLAKNGARQAALRIDTAKADAKLAEAIPLLEREAKLTQQFEAFNQLISKGAALLIDKRPFALKRTDGKDVTVGKGNAGNVLEVKDDTLQIEQNLGGGKAVLRWQLEQLTPQTRFELAKAGATGAPDASLKLALGALVMLQAGGDVTPKMVRLHLDQAKKENAPAELIAQINARLDARDREIAADAALKKVDAAIKEKRWPDAKKFLESTRKEFTGTLALAKAGDLDKKAADIDFGMNPSRPGLWASYWTSEGGEWFKNMVFARAESKLNYNWGDGRCDERVQDNDFAIKWAGKIRIDKDGTYRFKAWADDQAQLFLDGKKFMDHNQEQELQLTKGEHDFKFIYREFGGGANVGLQWKIDNQGDFQDIPATQFLHDPRQLEKYQKD